MSSTASFPSRGYLFSHSDPTAPPVLTVAGRKMWYDEGWCDSCEQYCPDLFPRDPESVFQLGVRVDMLCSRCRKEWDDADARVEAKRNEKAAYHELR